MCMMAFLSSVPFHAAKWSGIALAYVNRAYMAYKERPAASLFKILLW